MYNLLKISKLALSILVKMKSLNKVMIVRMRKSIPHYSVNGTKGTGI